VIPHLAIVGALCLLCALAPAITQAGEDPRVIRQVYIDRRDIFDPSTNDWFFAGSLVNALHTTTRFDVVEDELLFASGDDLDTAVLQETERNLRRIGVFASVQITTRDVGSDSVDVIVQTQDRLSLRPAVLLGTGGGITNVGGKVEEINLFGNGTQAMVYGLYRTENAIGWEGMAQLTQRRLFGSEINLIGALRANRIRTDQMVQVTQPYRTMSTPWAFSVGVWNAFGSDFDYRSDPAQRNLLPFYDREVVGWLSQASGERDRLFTSVSVRLSDVQRVVPSSRQAFDNTGHVLVAFSSITQSYHRSRFLDGYETEDVPEGAWGSAIIGRVFSLGNGGQTFWYLGGQAEQSRYVSPALYLHGRIQAGTGFGDRRARYTYLEINGLGHLKFSEHFVATARIRSQTAWNWTAFRQLVLDFETGLRGYVANGISGENRIFTNSELRWFPGWKTWILGWSAVAFYDNGTVWAQGDPLSSTRFHHAVGLGLRIHNLKAAGDDAVFRFDLAYNMDTGKIAGLIFNINQAFSAFSSHKYRAPDVLGRDIDLQ
jgi:hypothetical protein